METIKIIYFISSLGVGGTESQIQLLTQNIDKRFEITICTIKSKGNYYVESIKQNNIEIVQLEINKFTDIFKINKLISLLKKLNYLKKKNFDIIHSFLFYGKMIAVLFKIISGCKILIAGERNTGTWKKRRHILFERIADIYINKYIAISNAVKESLIKQIKLKNGQKVKVIYNGINENEFYIKETIDNECKVIAIVGRLHKVKGHKYFLDLALELIKAYDKKLKFWIIGEGNEKENLIEYSKKLNIQDSVNFLGCSKNMADTYNKIDILTICSYSEGFSNVAAEAMMCGIPVVAFGVGSLFEVIDDEKTGFLVEFGNVEKMKEKVILLLDNKEIYNKMSQSSIIKAKNNYTLKRLVSDIEQIYDYEYIANNKQYKYYKEVL